jgi:hypothetical protein
MKSSIAFGTVYSTLLKIRGSLELKALYIDECSGLRIFIKKISGGILYFITLYEYVGEKKCSNFKFLLIFTFILEDTKIRFTVYSIEMSILDFK